MSLYLGNTMISGVSTPIEPTRNIGQIITSTIPLTDAGLHLLDGSLIRGGGIYNAFVQYISDLVNTYPQCFCSEVDWQQSVNIHNACGKFVYDSTNNAVRLPKITGFIEGTTNATALGELVEAGLPNITGKFTQTDCQVGTYNAGANGAFYMTYENRDYMYGRMNSSENRGDLGFDASRSSPIYGNSDTVQPQSIKVFYYIVIATNTKTDVEIDIDEVITDLNSKANNADVVHKISDETITGMKTFDRDLLLKKAPNDFSITPQNPVYTEIRNIDINGNEIGQFRVWKDTDGANVIDLLGRYQDNSVNIYGATLGIKTYPDGRSFPYASANDDNNSIVTTVNKSKAANGYFKLSNGLIVQWGNAGGGGTITFPTPFSSDNFSVTATIKSANGTNDNDAITGKRATSFDFHNYSGGGCLWVAIGY